VSDDRPQQTSAQREYQDYAATGGGEQPSDREPDVLLDVPVLNVGAINLEVRGLRAHVAVLAELANFVNLSCLNDSHKGREVFSEVRVAPVQYIATSLTSS
jgi:hypothetical protein